MTAILTVLTAGVDFLVAHSLLPLVSIFIEPAKVLFQSVRLLSKPEFCPIELTVAEMPSNWLRIVSSKIAQPSFTRPSAYRSKWRLQ